MYSISLSLICLILAVVVSQVRSNTQVDVTLSSRDLPNMDIFDGPPDPYAVVYFSQNLSDPFQKIGQTQRFDNIRECIWPESFTFNLISGGSQQRIKIDVMDYDIDEDDQIGYVEFYLSDVANTFGNILDMKIIGFKNQGWLTVKGKINGTAMAIGKDVETDTGIIVPLVHQTNRKDIPAIV